MSHGSSQQQENSGFADSLKSPLMISSGVLALTFAPVLYAYLTQLWSREYYQFFPFAFAATLFFAATRTSQQPELSGNWLRQLFRVLLVAAAALTTAAGCLRS
ncbi:MAG: hypothetical protein ACKPJD_03565, partial [Planctomycetaceae bacterium]